jgi:hypothetical protein
MKKLLCSGVVVCLISSALPMQALASEATAAAEPAPRATLRTSIQRAVETTSLATTAPLANARQSTLSFPRPDRGPDRTRKQMGGGGGGKTGMIIGLVSAVAGVAATVYMVKVMKDSTKSNDD